MGEGKTTGEVVVEIRGGDCCGQDELELVQQQRLLRVAGRSNRHASEDAHPFFFGAVAAAAGTQTLSADTNSTFDTSVQIFTRSKLAFLPGIASNAR